MDNTGSEGGMGSPLEPDGVASGRPDSEQSDTSESGDPVTSAVLRENGKADLARMAAQKGIIVEDLECKLQRFREDGLGDKLAARKSQMSMLFSRIFKR